MAEINKSRPAVSGAGAVVHFRGEYRSVFLTPHTYFVFS